MPVVSTSPGILLPFINELEKKLEEIAPLIQEWEDKKAGIYKTQEELEVAKYQSINALAQAANANTELNNATTDIVATSPNKISALIANLRKEMLSLATGSGGSKVVINTFAVDTIEERNNLNIVYDGAICLVENTDRVDVGFEVFLRKQNKWIRISDKYIANIDKEIKKLEERIRKLEAGLIIYEGSIEPEDKTVLWIN